MSKTPPGPKEQGLRAMREAKTARGMGPPKPKPRTLIPYAGKPPGNAAGGTSYGAKHRVKK